MRQSYLLLLVYCVVFAVVSSCVAPIYPYTDVAPGTWRGVLYIDPGKSLTPGIQDRNTKGEKLFDENDVGVLPFSFDVVYTDDTTWHIEIINGEERIPVRDLKFERLKEDADMRLTMDFPIYDAHIEAEVREGAMQGFFVARSKENYRIPFSARHAQKHRFILPANPKKSINVDGQWKVTFGPDTEHAYDAIGEFHQDGNTVRGTFMTETGDYRYLDGIVDGNKLWLSAFDGAHAFLFHAKSQEDGSLSGVFRSGKHYTNNWVATKDPAIRLTNPDSLSKALTESFSITKVNQAGEMTSFPSDAKDKIKILQIMGTWCPNCKDETEFLLNYVENNPAIKLELAALAFERSKDENKALAQLRRYHDQLDMTYPILYGGSASKTAASASLPMIDKVISYPTMIILDKNNKIRKVHTGFNGPATSEYKAFVKNFDSFVKQLASE